MTWVEPGPGTGHSTSSDKPYKVESFRQLGQRATVERGSLGMWGWRARLPPVRVTGRLFITGTLQGSGWLGERDPEELPHPH